MTSPMPPQAGPAALDERDHTVLDVLPYGALAFCVLLSFSFGEPGPHARLAGLILSALSAAWIGWMYTLHPAWRRRPRVMALFITVLLVLGALLIVDNTLFGIYTFTIYFFVLRYLVWPWRLLGAAAVGLLAATSQAYGVNKDTFAGVVIYLVIVAVNVAIFLGYTWSRWTTTVLDDRRRQALEELSTANHRLEATLAENAGLQQQLLTQAREAGVQDERQRMAREIHDTLAQGLTGIITQLQAAEQAADDPAGWRRHFGAATRLARESLSEARRSVEALRPESLELARLSEALGDVAGRWSALHGIPVQVTTTGTARPMPSEAEFALLRTAQEALANVARHARATRVGVTLSYMEHQVALDVRDDGQGFDLKNLCAQANGSANTNSSANTNGNGMSAMSTAWSASASATACAVTRPQTAASAWSPCASASRAWPARCRSNPSRASAPASRPASRSPPGPRPAHDRSSHPPAHRRRPPGRPGRPERHVRPRPRLRGAGRGPRRRRGGQARAGPAARRDPDGPAHARHGRPDRHHRAGPPRDQRPGAGPDHVRHRQLRAARDRGGRHRLHAQGRPPGRTPARGPRRGPGSVGAVPGGHRAPDEPGPHPRCRAAQPPRARGPRAGGGREFQPRGRRPPVHHRGHGQDPPAQHLRQARRRRPRRRRRRGVQPRPAHPRDPNEPHR